MQNAQDKGNLYISSFIIENVFVNDDFEYGFFNEYRRYLEIPDKEEVKAKMREAMSEVD